MIVQNEGPNKLVRDLTDTSKDFGRGRHIYCTGRILSKCDEHHQLIGYEIDCEKQSINKTRLHF